MEKDKEFINNQLLRKSIELNIVGEIVRLYDMGMNSKTAMDIITQVLWNGDSSVAQEAMKNTKKLQVEIAELEDEEEDDDFEDDFENESDFNDKRENIMKGGLVK